VTNYEVPLAGLDYEPSIQRIFPPDVIEEMYAENSNYYNERAQRL
jgi:hypothetical protein